MMLGAFVSCNGVLDATSRRRLRIGYEHSPQILKPRSRERESNALLVIPFLAVELYQSLKLGEHRLPEFARGAYSVHDDSVDRIFACGDSVHNPNAYTLILRSIEEPTILTRFFFEDRLGVRLATQHFESGAT
jgi:hypothetical protein